MATVTFYNKDIEKFMSLDVFKSQIPELGMSVEDSNDTSIVVDITPNRPELLYFNNLIREILLHLGILKPRSYDSEIKNLDGDLYVSPEFRSLRPYGIAFAAKNIDLSGNSLEYLVNFTEKLTDTYGRKRKKVALGMHNLDKVEFPLFYNLSEDKEFTPLKYGVSIKFSDFIKEKDNEGYSSIFGNKDGRYPILKDNSKILSLVPVINSDETSVSAFTRNLLIDINGSDETAVKNTARIIASSLIDIGASIYPVRVHMTQNKSSFISIDLKSRRASLHFKDFNSRIGLAEKSEKCLDLISRSGYLVKSSNSTSATILIPPYRTDIFGKIDIIEDMAIAYGYNNINAKEISGIYGYGNLDKLTELKNSLAELSIGLGYTEALNFYLTSRQIEFEYMLHDDPGSVSLLSSKTSTFSIIRTKLLPNLMMNLKTSADQPMPQKLFEVGNVYTVKGNKVEENLNIAFVSEGAKVNFNNLKADLEALCNYLKVHLELKESKDPAFIEGRTADIYIDGIKKGIIGEINPEVLLNFGLLEPVSALELTIQKLDY